MSIENDLNKHLDLIKKAKIIVVLGPTRSGKVKIAKYIQEKTGYKYVCTDDYVDYGRDEKLEYIISDVLELVREGTPFILEGVQCYRILRRGAKYGYFIPELIIKTICNDETIAYCYEKEGEGHKAKKALAYSKSLETIWNDFIEIAKHSKDYNSNPPIFMKINTSLI